MKLYRCWACHSKTTLTGCQQRKMGGGRAIICAACVAAERAEVAKLEAEREADETTDFDPIKHIRTCARSGDALAASAIASMPDLQRALHSMSGGGV